MPSSLSQANGSMWCDHTLQLCERMFMRTPSLDARMHRKDPFKVIVHPKMNIVLLLSIYSPSSSFKPVGLSVFSRTQKERFSGMFLLLLSLQWKWMGPAKLQNKQKRTVKVSNIISSDKALLIWVRNRKIPWIKILNLLCMKYGSYGMYSFLSQILASYCFSTSNLMCMICMNYF